MKCVNSRNPGGPSLSRRLDLPVDSMTPAEAATHFGWFAHFAALDSPASSQRTRQLLGWQPQQEGLIADLNRDSYFNVAGSRVWVATPASPPSH